MIWASRTLETFNMNIRDIVGSLFIFCNILILFSAPSPAQAITTVRVAAGLERPVCAVPPPGDYSRLFILEQYTGHVRILKGNRVLQEPFLDIGERISTRGDERGLLGLAFHPDYERNGFFYLNYTRAGDAATIVSRFHVSSDADRADPESESVILTIPQPYANHNGGGIEFGPDGFLYIGMGDGGGAYDPENRSQDDQELLGKMLRIDVDHELPYRVPPDNPFVDSPARDEIWAKGLRNPWRFTFDRETHDLYIADVGQDRWEEIHVQPAGSKGGENYGWRCMEGRHCTGLTGCECNSSSLILPVHEYDHDLGCSITGGYVYRGCAIPELRGSYCFADYCSHKIWSFRYRSGGITDFRERTTEFAPDSGMSIGSISSFGQDNYGELYIVDLMGGEIFKIVPDDLDDCNRNYTSDRCEIAAGTSSDNNNNSVPDECEQEGAAPRTSEPVIRYAIHESSSGPFNPLHRLVVELPRSGVVNLAVYHVRERTLSTLIHEALSAGRHTVTFDASDHPAGIFVCELRAEGITAREKFLHLK